MTAVRRPPPVWPQRVATYLNWMVPGGFAGRVPGVGPVDGDGSDLDAVVDGAGAGSDDIGLAADSPWDDYFDATGGAEDLTLTYLPVENSLLVFRRGIDQEEDVDWTVDGQTLSVLSGMGTVAGDRIHAHYWYSSALPAEPVDADDIDDPIPNWQPATENGTQADPDNEGWTATGFPDGSAVWIWDQVSSVSAPEDESVYFRRHLTGETGDARVYLSVDSIARVYLNGAELALGDPRWTGVTAVDVTLTGDDWFAVEAINGAGIPEVNAAGLLLAVYRLVSGSPTDLLMHTDSGWETAGSPPDPPELWPGPWT